MAITDDVLAELGPDTITNIAQQLGLSPDKVTSVLTDAIPTLLGGMSNNVASDEGAASLANALGNHAGANPLGNIGELVSGALGNGILEKVFGGKVPDISDLLGGKSGTSGFDTQRILAIAAPLVLAILGKKLASGGKADPAVVQKEVQAESQQLPDLGDLLGSILKK